MRVLVFGGTGFVGLNIAESLLARGHAVTLFDRAHPPPFSAKAWACHAGRLTSVQSDIRDRQAVEAAVGGQDVIVLGAAITAGPEREAADPEAILGINLAAQTPVITAARHAGVKRIINLSSAAAYGASAFRNKVLDEETACDPVSLYAITKLASEKVAARLADLWQFDIISVRLSAVFGPWERSNDVRDTPSPQAQMLAMLKSGREAVLSRPGVRDWVYAVDVAEAVSLLIEADRPQHRLYNISTGAEWPALQWGQLLSVLHPGFVCRLAESGEAPTIDLYSAADRAPLSVTRLADEFGWHARFGAADSVADLSKWWTNHPGDI